jgi:Ca-activated chloride channel family protein
MNFTDPGNPAVAQLWGRHRIKDLMNQMVQYETKVGVETVTETALTYQLLSQYTAFVAVSDDVRVEPGTESISMNVPVEMAEAVEYEGIFGCTDYIDNGCTDWMEAEGELERGISFNRLEERVYRLRAPGSASAPSAPSKARRRRAKDPRGTSPVEVVSATGLDEVAIDSLNEHLATLTVPPGTNGELVLEIVFSKVRASRIVVDADASTLADVELLKTIKTLLFSWRIPHFIGDTVRLTLRVRS